MAPRIGENKALSKPVTLGASDTLKILLTTKEDNKAKRPHQAFLLVKDSKTGLDTSFAFQVKENGKGKIELVCSPALQTAFTINPTIQTQKDLPTQLLASTGPLDASLVVASFGSSKPYNGKAFDLTIELDSGSPSPTSEKPLRYGKLPEINHTFKSDPKSPPKIITLVFAAAVIAALPILLGAVSTTFARPIISANELLCSGYHLAQISTISLKLSAARQSRTRCSSARSWLWRACSSCITRLGTCSRHYHQLLA